MGLMDAFSREDTVEVKFSAFYALMKEAVKAELLMNAANCDTPHASMREMMTGSVRKVKHLPCGSRTLRTPRKPRRAPRTWRPLANSAQGKARIKRWQ